MNNEFSIRVTPNEEIKLWIRHYNGRNDSILKLELATLHALDRGSIYCKNICLNKRNGIYIMSCLENEMYEETSLEIQDANDISDTELKSISDYIIKRISETLLKSMRKEIQED